MFVDNSSAIFELADLFILLSICKVFLKTKMNEQYFNRLTLSRSLDSYIDIFDCGIFKSANFIEPGAHIMLN